jgi:tetratricopeptide (TPR) repeat protein
MKKIIQVLITFAVVILFVAHVNAQTPKKAVKTGKDQMKEAQYDAAVQSFTEAIGMDPKFVDAYEFRAQAYEKLNKLQDAITDFTKAGELDPKNPENYYNAGRILYILGKHMDAIQMLNQSIAIDKGYLNSYLMKVNALVMLGNYTEALTVCDQAIDVKKTAQNFYNHGWVSEYLNNDAVAEADYRKSIEIDPNYQASYIGLANVLTRQGKTDQAMTYCNQVLAINDFYTDAYVTRSFVYYKKSDMLNALADLSKAIDLDSKNEKLYFTRAGYYRDFKQPLNAINDYSKVISLNKKNYLAYYYRAQLFEESNKPKETAADYNSFLRLAETNPAVVDMVNKAKEKVYQLNAETTKPEIKITSQNIAADGSILMPKNAKKVTIEGLITDQSKIDYIKIDNVDYDYDKTSKSVSFSKELSIGDADKITISVADSYHNIATMTYKIMRTEIDPPVIDITTPYTSDNNEIFLDFDVPTVYLEGKVADESFIKQISVEGVDARFTQNQENPNFSVKVDIGGKDFIKFKATDIYGNTAEKSYKINRETAKIMATNPMGKTWVIFIDNSNYESFASLNGPEKDINTMKASFSKYDIHNVIVKKNLTKVQMERFFSIELRDMVKNNKVNSLLVWYAGHGKFINETGYWIPTDAKRDDEFSYFNINSLKSSMQSYSKYVTHVLVVTDACESGPSFYAAMRGAKKRECGDYQATKFKSSQVFSSSGYELASENSPFTKTFARSLDYNTNSCIAIDNIVISVTETVGQASKSAPKFGKIPGLQDDDGTFFFMKKYQ